VIVFLWSEGLGEDVRNLIFACDVTDFHLPFLNIMTDLAILDVDVLGLTVLPSARSSAVSLSERIRSGIEEMSSS
jgi:hypothetical protein